MGQDPLGEFFDAVKVEAVNNALERTAEESDKAGGAGRKAGKDIQEGMDEAKTGVDAVKDALAEYAKKAASIGKDVRSAFVNAFEGIENAIGEFVKTGKLSFSDLIASLLADLAQLAIRKSSQLTKVYASGAYSWTRTITKPVAGTVKVAKAGVLQTSGFSVDTTTGIVTFTNAPASGVAVTAGFEFDVPVRFDTDELPVVLDFERQGSITSITMIEVRR